MWTIDKDGVHKLEISKDVFICLELRVDEDSWWTNLVGNGYFILDGEDLECSGDIEKIRACAVESVTNGLKHEVKRIEKRIQRIKEEEVDPLKQYIKKLK